MPSNEREECGNPSVSEPLLLPKLQPPRQPPGLIKRERLLKLLDHACSHTLTLLLAPAGSGKTTLVSQWITNPNNQQRMPPAAWLSLESGDNVPIRFWRYICTACQNFHPTVSDSALASLSSEIQASFDPHFLEHAVTSLLNALTLHACPGLLVLEDYHRITDHVIHETLAFFLDHLPLSLHIILLSRSEPPLPLARWRASGMLQEIQTHDLRFSLEETSAFLQLATGCVLSEETIRRLDNHLVGWAAGLRLLTLSLHGRPAAPDIEQFLISLVNNHRPILDYFTIEVLATQEKSLQQFLLETSILNRLSGPLCDAVSDRKDSDLLLEEMERAGLFLQPLNRLEQWYRYHELFAEALQREARHRLGRERLHTLSLRACNWYETHDMLDEAIETALAIDEYIYAADLIERYTATNVFGGWHHTVHRWLAQMPEAILQTRPTLCFMYALTHLFVKDRFAAETSTFLEVQLQKAEQQWQIEDNQPKLGAVAALRSLVAWWQDDYKTSFAQARQALALLPADDIIWRGMSLLHVAMEEQFANHLNTARQIFTEARSLYSNNLYFRIAVTLGLGNLCFEQGALQQAEQYYRQALREAEQKENTLDDRGFALVGLARLAYEWNDIVDARQHATQALEYGNSIENAELQARSTLILARVLSLQGASERAQHVLQECIARTQTPRLLRELLLGQARLALACGDLLTAERWKPTSMQQNVFVSWAQREQEMLFNVRLLIAQKAFEKALTLLNSWQHEEFSRSKLEHLILSALTHSQLQLCTQPETTQTSYQVKTVNNENSDHLLQAKQHLLQALELTMPEAFRRIFLDEGEHLGVLLRAILPKISDPLLYAYACNLILSLPQLQADANIEASSSNPLSSQEERVLHLLAAGRTKTAIAQELIISVNTVKTHVKSIYRKLGATNRQEAFIRARALRLLP